MTTRSLAARLRVAIRKANIPTSKYERSRQVRGWGRTTPGARVREWEDGCSVEIEGAYGGATLDALRTAGFEPQVEGPDGRRLVVRLKGLP